MPSISNRYVVLSDAQYAVEGWSDSLRREVAPYGMHVSLIEPSFLKTPMVEDITARYGAKTWAACDEEVRTSEKGV